MRIVSAEEFMRTVRQGSDGLPDVSGILRDIREDGDDAVLRYTRRFDGDASRYSEIRQSEKDAAYQAVNEKVKEAINAAAQRIRAFAERQAESLSPFETVSEGTRMGQRMISLARVGCYVPGGRYPLPSTALMTVIPARVAGVDEVIVCSPRIDAVTIVAADIAGADRIFSVGGVQAIGAMAYGTRSIPKVDKIVGPGNSYVTASKKMVFGDVGIDMLAGPSEVLIIADSSCDPNLVAADLLAQAEHDPEARADVITFSRATAQGIDTEVRRQMDTIRTRDVAREALARSSIILVEDAQEALRLADDMAPEHLELQVTDTSWYEQRLRAYGSLFIGAYSAESFGDYCSGPNHTLPTGGAARYTGGLSPLDFVKVVTYQEMESTAAQELSSIAQVLAGVEGLDAHRKAAAMRTKMDKR